MIRSLALALTVLTAAPVDGQTLLQDINPGSPGGFRRGGASFRGKFLFNGTGGLWVSTGTPEGTELVLATDTELRSFVPFDGQVYFLGGHPSGVDNFDLYLWRTNGAETGTEPVAFLGNNVGYRFMFAVDGQLLMFLGNNELWTSDGTTEGTEFAASLPSSSAGYNSIFAHAGGLVYFVPTLARNELWRTDGTPEGTFLLRQFEPFLQTDDDEFLAVGSQLVFAATSAEEGRELWFTDGSVAGTELVADLYPGPSPFNSDPRDLVALDNGLVLFGATDGSGLPTLWRSDLTAAGTHSVPLSVTYVDGLVAMDDEAFFFASNGFFMDPAQMWKTDGTVEGSMRFADANPALTDNGVGIARVGSDKHVVFRGNYSKNIFSPDPSGQAEPWYSNGTPQGTFRIADVNPGVQNSLPTFEGEAGGYLFFSANDGTTGWELHAVNIGELGSWSAKSFGAPCSSTNDPRLDLAGPATLGSSVSLELAGAEPFAPSTFYYSAFGGGLIAAGCGFYVGLPQPFLGGSTDGEGALSISIDVPPSPALVGKAFYFQSLTLSDGGPVLGLADLSQGLEVVFGPQ